MQPTTTQGIPGMVPFDFTDGHVGIRPFRPEDVSALYAAVKESTHELHAWMVWCKADYSMQDATAFVTGSSAEWEKGNQFSFAIYSTGDGAILGSIGLSQINRGHNFANLGYWVRSSRTHRGIATTAARLAARFGLQKLGLSRLELVVPVANEFSRRVAEKIGAKNEGILRKRLLLQNRLHDAFIFSLVAEDLDKVAADGRILPAVV
jgi:RimJ/RimL family protein N-acetyltransferase